jgi:biopolymer transport protein ExbD
MRISDDDDEETPEVNMAPLLDCVFLLLIFFLLTSTIQKTDDERKKEIQQLVIDLPESAAAATAPAQPAPLVISVDASGHYHVNNSRVGLEELHQVLREASATHPKIRIEGDRRVPFDAIAHVLDLCEFEGLNEIAVRTQDK